MLTIINDNKLVQQKLFEKAGTVEQLSLLKSRTVALSFDLKHNDELWDWCENIPENVTCLHTRMKPVFTKKKGLPFIMPTAVEKLLVFIFENESTALQFKLTFNDCTSQYWD